MKFVRILPLTASAAEGDNGAPLLGDNGAPLLLAPLLGDNGAPLLLAPLLLADGWSAPVNGASLYESWTYSMMA